MASASVVARPRLKRPGRPPRAARPASTPIAELGLAERTCVRLSRLRLRTLDDLARHGADGLLALGIGERLVAALTRAMRRAGTDLPGTTLAGGPKLARCRCDVCGWARSIPRCRIGTACPVCGAAVLGPRSGRPAKRPEAKLVRLAVAFPRALLAAVLDGLPPRQRAARIRALVSLGLRAERATVETARPRRTL